MDASKEHHWQYCKWTTCARLQGPNMVQPLKKVKVLHKHKGKFKRHQSDTNVSVPVSSMGWLHGDAER